MTVARCPAKGCRRRCRNGADRCVDHELPSLASLAAAMAHDTLAQVAHGTISNERAERILHVVFALVDPT